MIIDYSDTINRFAELDAYPMLNISKIVEDVAQYSFFTTLALKSPNHQIPIRDNDRKYITFEIHGK